MSSFREIANWLEFAAAAGAITLAMLGVHACLRRRPRRLEPLCGRCRYILTGMASEKCPECGGEPGKVGVICGGAARLNFGRAALWSAILACLAWWGLGQLNYPLLQYYKADAHATFRYAIENNQDLCQWNLRLSAEGWSSVIPPQMLQAEYHGIGERGTVNYDFPRHVWTLSPMVEPHEKGPGSAAPPLEVRGPLTPSHIQSCFRRTAIPPQVADEVCTLLTRAAALSDTAKLEARPSLRPPIAYWSTSVGGSVGAIHTLFLGRFAPWICLAIWGSGLPFLRLWAGGILFGEDARRHLRKFAPERTPL